MKDQDQKEIDKINMYKRVFNGEDGKVILRDLLRSGNFFTGTFNPCVASMSFEEGRRSIVMEILRTTQIDLETVIEQMNHIQSEENVYGNFN